MYRGAFAIPASLKRTPAVTESRKVLANSVKESGQVVQATNSGKTQRSACAFIPVIVDGNGALGILSIRRVWHRTGVKTRMRGTEPKFTQFVDDECQSLVCFQCQEEKAITEYDYRTNTSDDRKKVCRACCQLQREQSNEHFRQRRLKKASGSGCNK